MNIDEPYLFAVFKRRSFEVTTRPFSPPDLTDFIDSDPAAIALAPGCSISVPLLLSKIRERWGEDDQITIRSDSRHPKRSHGWKLYEQQLFQGPLQFHKMIEQRRQLDNVFKSFVNETPSNIAVLISAADWATRHEPAIRSSISESIIPIRAGPLQSDREQVRRVRQEMLDKIKTFTSEELAAHGESTNRNASQYALDLRDAGKLFGVRFGRVWHYPRFQFDREGGVYSEMKEVLLALSPDSRGWDRLQWFLTPHQILEGKTPLEVWEMNRRKVVQAAMSERWDGRD